MQRPPASSRRLRLRAGEYGPDLGQIMVLFQYPDTGLILGEMVEMHVSFVSIPVPVTGEQGTVQSYEL